MNQKIILFSLAIVMGCSPVIKEPIGNTYFISNEGHDNNTGTEGEPWKSVGKLATTRFLPGDRIFLERGSVWTEGIVFHSFGIRGKPITISSYGEGTNPIVSNPSGSNWSSAIRLYGSWIIVENLTAEDAHFGGVEIKNGSDHNVIRNIEVRDVGIGIIVGGRYNLITMNHVHDLHIVHNDLDGKGDDFGAVGVMLSNGNNEVSFNRLINCKARSFDFGEDGGAVEIYADSGDADNSRFMYNYAENTEGFIEMHSNNRHSAKNITIAYNVAVNTRAFSDIGMPGYKGGHELTEAEGIRIEHNTIVDTRRLNKSSWPWEVFSFHGVTPKPDQVLIRNNIIYVMSGWQVSSTGGFLHENNIYHFNPERDSLGFSLDPTEMRADPMFADIEDFRLKPGSPAIDLGEDLGYERDFSGNMVPSGKGPDAGAYES